MHTLKTLPAPSRFLPALSVCLLLLAPASVTAEWALHQNDPEPFCNDPGLTTISAAIDVPAEVLLQVVDADSSVVRVLIQGLLPPGYHSIIWDGRDEQGELLPPGPYPYILTAIHPELGNPLFQATRVATIECPTPSGRKSWGRLKHRYQE